MKFEVEQHPEFISWVSKEVHGAMHKAMLVTASRVVHRINTEIIPGISPHQPVDRGTARAGYRVETIGNRVYIVNHVLHALFMEEGVRAENVKPGRAMIAALAAWAKRKGLDVSKYQSSAMSTKRESLSIGSEPYTKLAWGIAKSMKKKGIFGAQNTPSGLQIIHKAMSNVKTWLSDEMKRELSKIR